MRIDWVTLGAQVFNFALLGFLLWLVLYRPLKAAAEERERRIEERLAEAEEEQEEARAMKEEYRGRKVELEEKSAELLAEAEAEAEERRKELREELRQEIRGVREEWEASLRSDMDQFLDELARRSRDEIFHILRQALDDLLETAPGEAVLETFLHAAEKSPEDDRERFMGALAESDGACRLRTALELPDDAEDRVRELLRAWMEENGEMGEVGGIDLALEEDADGPRGIELWAGHRKLAWSVDAYLEGMREELTELLKEEAGEGEEDEKDEGDEEDEKDGES